MTPTQPDHHTLLEDAWGQVVGSWDWLKAALFGEFVDNRPLSAVVADMLLSFIPAVVIVTSVRDAIAIILRLANHPEKREELMEWVLLCACLIVVALPVAMAVGGAAAAGVGAIVGGIAGSELGAALRAVMLMLIKEAAKLVDVMRFLQKFMKGDISKFLRAIKFAKYEKALIQALRTLIGKLLHIVQSLRTHLEGLRYFDSVKATIAKLAAWEKKFYAVQQDALNKVPKALTELDARLTKVLAQTAPKEAHTVSAGVQADKTAAALPARQRIRDTPGKVLAKVEDAPPAAHPKPHPRASPAPKPKDLPPAQHEPPLKDAPEPGKPVDEGANTKKQAVADAAATADRERITQLSSEAREAQKSGDAVLAQAKIEEARDILRPYVPKNPTENWDEVVKRLDVSSPKDGAVFWSGTAHQAEEMGQPDAARLFADNIGGVTLESTPGGRIIDGWDEVNKGLNWDKRSGAGPYARDLWAETSTKYARGTSGNVNVVQTANKLQDTNSLWHNKEKNILVAKLGQGDVTSITMHSVDPSGNLSIINDYDKKLLLKLKGTAP